MRVLMELDKAGAEWVVVAYMQTRGFKVDLDKLQEKREAIIKQIAIKYAELEEKADHTFQLCILDCKPCNVSRLP